MEKSMTVKDRIKRWRSLSELVVLPNKDEIKVKPDANDPYDCSDLVIPSKFQLVKNMLEDHLKEWEELDSRVVVPESSARGENNIFEEVVNGDDDNTGQQNIEDDNVTPNEDNEIEQPPVGSGDYAGLKWGWHANRIRLPDFFDYASRGDPPQLPVIEAQRSKRRKVISIEDPTQLLDYECELWKIFKNIPIAAEIENEATQGSICKETLKMKKEIQEGLKEYTRLDGHALNRLRKKERHHWPRVCLKQSKKSQYRHDSCNGLGEICGATIRVECWRRQLRRGSASDENRCEAELIDSQTLLDLHYVLVNSSQDDLFDYAMRKDKSSNSKDANVKNLLLENSSSPGYFFIEDTFYTNGEVDYVSPILKWLDEEVPSAPRRRKDDKNPRKKRKYDKKAPPTVIRCRRQYLGISRNVNIKVVPMKDAKLCDIPFRLACRYIHVFNGDCESAVFFSDVCMRMTNENLKEMQYPLIHDIFTTTTSISTVHETSICQGCNRGSATVMTLNDEMTDGGPTLLCPLCHAKLHYDKDGKLWYNNFEVVPLNVLQNLRDLSVGNDTTDVLF